MCYICFGEHIYKRIGDLPGGGKNFKKLTIAEKKLGGVYEFIQNKNIPNNYKIQETKYSRNFRYDLVQRLLDPIEDARFYTTDPTIIKQTRNDTINNKVIDDDYYTPKQILIKPVYYNKEAHKEVLASLIYYALYLTGFIPQIKDLFVIPHGLLRNGDRYYTVQKYIGLGSTLPSKTCLNIPCCKKTQSLHKKKFLKQFSQDEQIIIDMSLSQAISQVFADPSSNSGNFLTYYKQNIKSVIRLDIGSAFQFMDYAYYGFVGIGPTANVQMRKGFLDCLNKCWKSCYKNYDYNLLRALESTEFYNEMLRETEALLNGFREKIINDQNSFTLTILNAVEVYYELFLRHFDSFVEVKDMLFFQTPPGTVLLGTRTMAERIDHLKNYIEENILYRLDVIMYGLFNTEPCFHNIHKRTIKQKYVDTSYVMRLRKSTVKSSNNAPRKTIQKQVLEVINEDNNPDDNKLDNKKIMNIDVQQELAYSQSKFKNNEGFKVIPKNIGPQINTTQDMSYNHNSQNQLIPKIQIAQTNHRYNAYKITNMTGEEINYYPNNLIHQLQTPRLINEYDPPQEKVSSKSLKQMNLHENFNTDPSQQVLYESNNQIFKPQNMQNQQFNYSSKESFNQSQVHFSYKIPSDNQICPNCNTKLSPIEYDMCEANPDRFYCNTCQIKFK